MINVERRDDILRYSPRPFIISWTFSLCNCFYLFIFFHFLIFIHFSNPYMTPFLRYFSDALLVRFKRHSHTDRRCPLPWLGFVYYNSVRSHINGPYHCISGVQLGQKTIIMGYWIQTKVRTLRGRSLFLPGRA